MDILSKTSRGVGYIHIGDSTGFLSGIESVYDDLPSLSRGTACSSMRTITRPKSTRRPTAHIPISRIHSIAQTVSGRSFDDAHGSITPEVMMEFLSDHAGHPKSICTHVDAAKPAVFASMSLCSFIMIPGEGRMLISSGPPCENEYVEYRL